MCTINYNCIFEVFLNKLIDGTEKMSDANILVGSTPTCSDNSGWLHLFFSSCHGYLKWPRALFTHCFQLIKENSRNVNINLHHDMHNC